MTIAMPIRPAFSRTRDIIDLQRGVRIGAGQCGLWHTYREAAAEYYGVEEARIGLVDTYDDAGVCTEYLTVDGVPVARLR